MFLSFAAVWFYPVVSKRWVSGLIACYAIKML